MKRFFGMTVAATLLALAAGADEAADRFARIHAEFLKDGRKTGLEGVRIETPAVKHTAERWLSADGRRSAVLVTNGDAEPRTFAVEAPGWFYSAHEVAAPWGVRREDPIPAGASRLYAFINPPRSPYPVAEGAPETLKPVPGLGYMRGDYDGRHYRYFDILHGIAAAGGKDFDCIWLGDSITHFWQAGGKDAVAREQLYKRKFGGLRILNAGMGGITVQQLLWNIVCGGFLDGCKAKCVTVLIGTNNVWNDSPEDIAKGIEACLKEIRIRQPQARVLLISLLPRDVRAKYDEKTANEVSAKIVAVNRIIRAFADGRDVLWIDLHDRYLDAEGRAKKELFKDGTHPSVAGYEIWADAILPYLR